MSAEHDNTPPSIHRRRFLTMAGLSGAGVLAAACGSERTDQLAAADDGDSALPVVTAQANAVDEIVVPATADEDAERLTTTIDGWVDGGTDQITVAFPADSIFADAGTCDVALSTATTLGPCYFADDTGSDISTGLTGLPMQLCLRVIDASCNPVSGMTVEVWHCDVAGIYSGDTSQSSDSSSFAGSFCTGGDSDAAASTWFRGQLTTDSNGRVDFASCFPGWYRGRTLHIHFAVSDQSGRRLVSQLCFPDALATEIYTTHPSYSSRGDQDTPLSSGDDTVFPSDFAPYQLTTQRNADGTLLAYHTLQIS